MAKQPKLAPGAWRAVSANRLADGRVVYLGEAGWVDDLSAARRTAEAAAAEMLLAEAERDVAAAQVVAPYLIDLEPGEVPRPLRRRERIRADGPGIAAGSRWRGGIAPFGGRKD